jgi:hypothetical protein
LKRVFKPNHDSNATKLYFVPKVFSREKTVPEVSPKLAKTLKGNLPWIAWLPGADYFLVTAHRDKPSTMLPVLAYHTAEGNELERRFWGLTSSSASPSHSEAEAPSLYAGSSGPFDFEDMNLGILQPDLENVHVQETQVDVDSRRPESYFYRMLHEASGALSR